MTTDLVPFPADPALVSAFGPFYALVPAVDTLRMLSTLLKNERVAQFLAPYDVTFAVVIRDFAAQDDDPAQQEPGRTEVTVPDRWDDQARIGFSTPMLEALQRCRQQPSLSGAGDRRSPVDLLAAILQDPGSRAGRNLAEVGVDVAELRESLLMGEPRQRDDAVPTELHSTREALLGRRKYRPRDLGQFWTTFFVRFFPHNPGHAPSLWARLEAGDLAERHGGRVRSDDLLLAVLRTHALAQLYPHMIDDSQEDSRAGEILTAAGLDHVRVQAVIESTDLGQDAVPLKNQLRNFPVGTTELLRRLLAEPGNRAVRLLRELEVDPAALSV